MNRIWRKQDPHSGENDRTLQMYFKETRRTQSPKFIKDLALVSYTRRVGEAVPQIQVRNHSKAQRGTAANDIPLSSISAIIEHRQDGKEPVNRLVGQHICKDLSLPFVCKVERLPFSSTCVGSHAPEISHVFWSSRHVPGLYKDMHELITNTTHLGAVETNERQKN